MNYIRTLLITTTILLASFHLNVQAASYTALEKASGTLLIMGDSLSAAYNLSIEKGWVSLIEQELASVAPKITVINASVSGETTQGGLARFPSLIEKHQPNWVVLELGANDGLRGYPLTKASENLLSMINITRQYSAKPLLIGNRLPSNYGKRYTQAFFNLYKDLAKKEDIAYMPFMLENVALDKTLMLGDGLHPNEKGQKIVLENIRPYILKLISK
ncbi:arylesterase [Marinomonas balearica]|uniref:Acyl-CoA thioesterase-1 n=1 Tax=Marinomonas balearica TaxID=491947 RepID=A0A4R6M7D5_9GAMM|nr:arylesterase [Marinomonas balearica]TDO96785.1 acyl-CoA thioesterase-1 [Marinomonas balearica]